MTASSWQNVSNVTESFGGSKHRSVANRDFEMEELEPSSEELREWWGGRQIARRIAAGDPDPWDGKAPDGRIYELEMRRVVDKELTPGEKNELQLITRLYPERVEKTRKMLARRHYRPDLLSCARVVRPSEHAASQREGLIWHLLKPAFAEARCGGGGLDSSCHRELLSRRAGLLWLGPRWWRP